MIKFYFNHAPNPKKIALFLQESGLDFEPVPVDNMKGEQHGEAFRKINPNSKLPAIEDDGKRVFDSTAILLYLADKHGIFNGKTEDRSELLSWLMFIGTGVGPYSGQSVHFRHMAPEKLDYAVNRYLREAQRHYQILDDHLAGKDYFVSDEFTIVDISAWGWIDRAEVVLGEDALKDYPTSNAGSTASTPAHPWLRRARSARTSSSRPSVTKWPCAPCSHRTIP